MVRLRLAEGMCVQKLGKRVFGSATEGEKRRLGLIVVGIVIMESEEFSFAIRNKENLV